MFCIFVLCSQCATFNELAAAHTKWKKQKGEENCWYILGKLSAVYRMDWRQSVVMHIALFRAFLIWNTLHRDVWHFKNFLSLHLSTWYIHTHTHSHMYVIHALWFRLFASIIILILFSTSIYRNAAVSSLNLSVLSLSLTRCVLFVPTFI